MSINYNLSDKTIVITGGSSGIGAAAARIFCRMHAHVIITGRSAETSRLAAEIGCDYFIVDYTKLADIKKFATDLLAKYPRIDVLVNNVGGIIADRRVTSDGLEQTFQVNHLSGFLLTMLLQQRLEESKAMIINTSSVANTFADLNFDDLQAEKKYSSLRAYGNAKLMNILHIMEIAKRFRNVKAYSFHPGTVRTGFAREDKGIFSWVYETALKNIFLIAPEKGADTLIWLVAENHHFLKSGEYFYKRKAGKKNKQATDTNAVKLWEVSEALVKNFI